MTAIHRAIEEYLAAQATEGKAERTLEVYGARLRRFADWRIAQGKAEPESLSAADLRAFIAYLQTKGNGNGTPRQNAVVIKGFSRWLFSEGKLQADPFTTVNLARPLRKIPEPFSDEEVRLLLKATHHTRDPQRNKAILLVLLSPVLILAAVAIRLDSPGPILLTQKRIGKNGRAFGFLKFRSMYHMADRETHREFAREYINGNSSRAFSADRPGSLYKAASRKQVTRVGRFLRKSSIDELPQLVNVLKGDMSLVGPRPSIHYEMAEYRPWHMRRLDVLPGLTGWAQIHGRSTLRFDDIATLDLEYIRTRSWRMDLMILLRTIPVVLSAQGAG